MRFRSIVLCLASFLCLGGLTVGFSASEAHAQAAAAERQGEQRYFEALYDIPVMEGLEEVKDAAMVFDKPDGRIASAVGVSRSLSPEAVQRFYGEVLPQLGWRKKSLNQYVRDGSFLSLDVRAEKGLTSAHFTLSPRTP